MREKMKLINSGLSKTSFFDPPLTTFFDPPG